MKKHLIVTVLLVGVLLQIETALAQQKWVPQVMFFKKPLLGNPNAVGSIDQNANVLTVAGWYDSLKVYNYAGTAVTQRLKNLTGMAKRVDTTWQSAGNVILADAGDMILTHISWKDSDYVSVYPGSADGKTTVPGLQKLNKVTNAYESVRGLNTIDGYATSLQDWGGENIALIGADNGTFSHINGASFRQFAVWNAHTGVFQHITNAYGEGAPGINAGSKMFGDTFYAGGIYPKGYVVEGIKKGTFNWIHDISTPLTCNRSFLLEVVEPNEFYVLTGQAPTPTNLTYELDHYANGTWTKLLTFQPADYINVSVPFEAMLLHDGVLTIGGLFTKVNGQSSKGLIDYNVSTGVVAEFSSLPADLAGMENCEGIYLFDQTMYMAVKTIFGYQTLYAFNDLTPPTISSVAVSVNKNNALLSGTSTANVAVSIYSNAGVKLTTVNSDASGLWNATLSALVDGAYSVYAVAQNSHGIASVKSAVSTFTIFTATPAAPIINALSGVQLTNSVVITGKVAANTTVNLYKVGVLTKITSVIADANGNWTAGLTLPDAVQYGYYATAQNINGESAKSGTILFSVDANPPLRAPIISKPLDGQTFTATTSFVKVTVKADKDPVEPKSTTLLLLDGGSQQSFTDSLVLNCDLGPHVLLCKEVDSVGHVSVATTTVRFMVVSAPSVVVMPSSITIEVHPPYPNESKTVINVPDADDGKDVNLTNTKGTIVITQKKMSNSIVQLNVENIPNGQYVVSYIKGVTLYCFINTVRH